MKNLPLVLINEDTSLLTVEQNILSLVNNCFFGQFLITCLKEANKMVNLKFLVQISLGKDLRNMKRIVHCLNLLL